MKDVSNTTLAVLAILAVVTSVIAIVTISETPTMATLVEIPVVDQFQENPAEEKNEKTRFTQPVRSQEDIS